ncbi:MAG TPA: helix-turn-helix transcriptional regulator [Gaiellales bacterium]|nr:helix-turn-helix transcriptional regulator [Gaiellales bacterium]
MAKSGKKKSKAARDDAKSGRKAGRASIPFRAGLETLMRERGISYRGLGERIGLSAGYINHMVHGNRPVPSDELIVRIAETLGVEPDTFTEYRIRRIDAELERRPELADRTYRELCR